MRSAAILAFVFGVLLIAASFGLAARERSQKRLALDNALSTTATEESGRLNDYFQRARAVLLLTARDPSYRKFYEARGTRVEKVQAGGPILEEVNDSLAYLERLYPKSIGEACFIDRNGAENARVVRGERATFADLSPDETGNPFFRPTFALRPGEVYQARPYVSPDTQEWVISNSTPLEAPTSPAPAIVHFEVTIESFRREMTTLDNDFDVAVVDADTGLVIIDSRFPQRVGAVLGQPGDRRFVSLVASGAGAGVRTIADHRTAFERLSPLVGNANDWYVVTSDPATVPSFLGDAGPAPFGLASAGLALLLLAGVSFRSSRRALQIAAHTDSLTSLANRRQLMDDLAVAFEKAATGERFALALFDLDGFKAYNDTFGHVPGDALLRRLAQKLAYAVEGWGDAYRLGGDEFCVLVRLQGGGPEQVALLGATALAEEGQGFSITASTGTVLLPDEAGNPSDALTAADLRMYVQKNRGRPSPARQAADVLLRVLHERSEPFGPHAVEVADLAEAVGLRLGLPEHRMELLRQAAELHDVGKMAIPDAVLDKAGPLDDDEWRLMREHTLIGERILSSAPALAEVGTIVRATHERIDGGGYPDGLAGEEIPLESRVIAVADAFCVMTTERPYDVVRSTKGAMDELWRCSGTQFDPAVVEAMAAVLTEMAQPAESVAIARRAVG